MFEVIQRKISTEDKVIWIHAASLGEYEQAVPVMEGLKKIFPKHKILVTFFSPSGYEVKKNSALADAVTYLPLDTAENAKKFLDLVNPDWVLFVKYEFWPNFLQELKRRKIKALLISGGFREDQIFFKSYGRWMGTSLQAFQYFFVQNEKSQRLLKSIGFFNVTVSGDTRFDRVMNQLSQNNRLSFVEEFKNNKICLVAGSTWPEDEEILLHWINNENSQVKVIIAPHVVKPGKLVALKEKIEAPAVLYSEKEGKKLEDYQVLIIDTIGLLTKIYSYADVAYVGGAVGDTGLHNILEPATFGIPIISGSNISKFPEARDLAEEGGLFTISDKQDFEHTMKKLVSNDAFRVKTGKDVAAFVRRQAGATQTILHYVEKFCAEEEVY